MQPQKKPRANALLADFWELATQFAETQGQGRSLLTFRLLKTQLSALTRAINQSIDTQNNS